MGIRTIFILIMMHLYMGAAPAFAQSGSGLDALFTIRGLTVDESAQSAAIARAEALKKAEEIAYGLLLGKLTQEEDRVKLPELGRAERQALIHGVEVREEKSSSRRYVATLDIAFEPELVSRFFARYGVPHIFNPGAALLVVHGHKRGPVLHFWQEDSILRAAREGVDWINRLRGYEWPRGDISDRIALSAAQVEAADMDAALSLAANYGRSAVIVINSRWQGNALQYEARLAPAGLVLQGEVMDGANEVDALRQMYSAILSEVDRDWRAKLLVDVAQQGELRFTVPSVSLEDWIDIQRRIKSVALVRAVHIEMISLPLSQIRVEYAGSYDQLILALAEVGLQVQTDGAELRLTTAKLSGTGEAREIVPGHEPEYMGDEAENG